MKRFLYAVSAAALFAAVGVADDKPVAPAPSTPAGTTDTNVITSAAPVTGYAPAAQSTTTRRGLFGRLRNRNTSTMSYSSPTMTSPTMSAPPTGATPMPPVAPPQAMPGTKSGAMMTPPMTGAVVQASGNLPAGTYTTTDGTIVQIGGTQMATPTTTTAAPRGLFSRLRSR